MMKFPVLSAPVQRALPGTAVFGGAVQASYGWGPFGPSEGADQAWSNGSGQVYYTSEGADQAGFMNAWGPSES
jgi:hypothetical protein